MVTVYLALPLIGIVSCVPASPGSTTFVQMTVRMSSATTLSSWVHPATPVGGLTVRAVLLRLRASTSRSSTDVAAGTVTLGVALFA